MACEPAYLPEAAMAINAAGIGICGRRCARGDAAVARPRYAGACTTCALSNSQWGSVAKRLQTPTPSVLALCSCIFALEALAVAHWIGASVYITFPSAGIVAMLTLLFSHYALAQPK